MEAASTDGHRLAVMKINNVLEDDSNLDSSDFSESDNFSVTLPSRSLKEVERLISFWSKEEVVSLFFDQGQVVILAADQILTSRILEGEYPNYRQLVPESFNRNIQIDRMKFVSALDRVASI